MWDSSDNRIQKIETLGNRGQNVNSRSEMEINTVKFFTKPVVGKWVTHSLKINM